MMREKGETMPEQPAQADLTAAWGVNLTAAVCEQCDWSYLLPAGSAVIYCPHCFEMPLTPLPQQAQYLPYTRPPEVVLPFAVSEGQLAQTVQNFAHGIWFAPADLKPKTLQARLQRLYLPMWLVDSDAQADWQAEVGFNYNVVSHQDNFNDHGGWQSREVTETRARWEPRLGRLSRSYTNTSAPALEEHAALQQQLGQFNLETGRPYQTTAVAGAVVRLPNRLPTDAWPDAVPAIQAAAAEECRQAARADHIRQFRWQAGYNHLNWTLLLLPVYATYYLDDAHKPQPLLIHGQTGRVSGPRRASMKRAQTAAIIILVIAAVIFTLSLLVGLVSLKAASLVPLAVIGVVLALGVGAAAIIPIGLAWQVNRKNQV
jgi:hypothetical protein